MLQLSGEVLGVLEGAGARGERPRLSVVEVRWLLDVLGESLCGLMLSGGLGGCSRARLASVGSGRGGVSMGRYGGGAGGRAVGCGMEGAGGCGEGCGGSMAGRGC